MFDSNTSLPVLDDWQSRDLFLQRVHLMVFDGFCIISFCWRNSILAICELPTGNCHNGNLLQNYVTSEES